MIKRIPKITNMGVFKDVNWNRDVRDAEQNVIEFKKLNIIYGRNYSGKTTLSRIIRAYETKEMPSNHNNARFELQLEDDGLVKSGQLDEHTQEFRVFNKDFVADNLSFLIDEKGDIEAFALLGKPNLDVQNQIRKIEQEIGTNEPPIGLLGDYERESTAVQGMRDRIKKNEDSLNRQLVDKANKDIKQNREYGDVLYNVKKLREDIERVLTPDFKDIDPDSVAELKTVLSEKPKDPIDPLSMSDLDLDNLIDSVRELVERRIDLTEPVQDLVNDQMLEAWARHGMDLHRDKRSVCGFCSSPLPEDLFEKLDAHFNEESESLREELERARSQINEIRENRFVRFDVQPSQFYLFLRESIEALDRDWKLFSEELDSFLDDLEDEVNARLDSISTSLEFTANTVPSLELEGLQARYNENVRKHNEARGQLEERQEEARTKLRLHDVKEFTKIIKYEEKIAHIDKLKKEKEDKELDIEKIQKELRERYTKIEQLRAKIVGEEAARTQINGYLNYHLGHSELSLESIEGEDKDYKFEIRRHGKPAYNLSEGERTLVAFCYFMAKLKDIPKDQQPIIWIDDPISSLDSNHIFYIFGLIESEIIRPNTYKQLFVSTHNLDFLKYLLRIRCPKRHRQLLVLEFDGKRTLIKKMPKYMEEFASEFNYLFHQIVQAAVSDNEAKCLAFPNEARKFLELFLRFKYPNPSLKESQLYEKFFSKRVQDYKTVNRLINEDSHYKGRFEKALRPIYRPEQKKIANAILCNICENDQNQFDALMKSIGYKERNKQARRTCLRRAGSTNTMCYF